jgi:hypothetical protein
VAAARRINPGPEWNTALARLRKLDQLTTRWNGTPTEVADLDGAVTGAREAINRFGQTLDRNGQMALTEGTDDFVGCADALLGFEKTAPTTDLTPAKTKQLAVARKSLWRDLRRTLNSLKRHVEDLDQSW